MGRLLDRDESATGYTIRWTTEGDTATDGGGRTASAESSFAGGRKRDSVPRPGAEPVADLAAAARLFATRFTRRSFVRGVHRGGVPRRGRLEEHGRGWTAGVACPAVGTWQRQLVRRRGPHALRRLE